MGYDSTGATDNTVGKDLNSRLGALMDYTRLRALAKELDVRAPRVTDASTEELFSYVCVCANDDTGD